MTRRLVVVDAFTDRPFSGNPAAVCVLDAPADEAWMSAVAREMNLSETAFLHPEGEGYRLRWLTPTTEVDLCGHATLASALALWQSVPGDELRFFTRSGRLIARRRDDRVLLDFPRREPEPCEPPRGLLEALGVQAVGVCRVGRDYLVELAAAAAVRDTRPDVTALARVEARGVMVTAPADDPSCDFVSRFFAPAVGIPEDPVTGAAHCMLGPFWAGRLGRSSLRGYQASARGGLVEVDVGPSVDPGRVVLAGRGVIVSRVEMLFSTV